MTKVGCVESVTKVRQQVEWGIVAKPGKPGPSHPLSSLLSSPLLGCDDDGGGDVIDDHHDIDIDNCDDIL